MKPIFNSLGSNYSFSFALSALSRLFSLGDSSPVDKLEEKLSQMFNGRAFTFYKGRDAIEFSLKSLGINKGDSVITQAFTCWAVEEAIIRACVKPVFVDLEKNKLNPSENTLDRAYKKASNVKAVIIQHTFGYPADIEAIRAWCDEKKLFLIEDLAQAIGAEDSKARKLGTLADAVILSFGRDKVVDAISGGACVIKVKSQRSKVKSIKVNKQVPFIFVIKDLIYPILTLIIRSTYRFGFGKLLHFILKTLGFMSSPTFSPISEMSKMSTSHAWLTLKQLDKLEKEIQHRKKIAKYYVSELTDISLVSDLQVGPAANLRFPVLVNAPEKVIECLKIKKIFLEDRWYKSAVDSGSIKVNSNYKNSSCPNAEKLSKYIINLPTHRSVSENDAKRIVKELKQCQN